MTATKKSVRILGALFAVSILVGVTSTLNRGLAGLTFDSTEVIQTIIERTAQMKMAMTLDLLGSAINLMIGVFLFQFFQSMRRPAAYAHLILTIASTALVIYSNMIHWQLIDGTHAESGIISLEALSAFYDQYYVIHFFILLLYSFTNFILFYFMWNTRWIPNWISVWGTLASALVTYGAISSLLDVSPPFIIFGQNGLFMIFFTFWLLVAGFNTKRLASL